jgi:hypothetical protein
LPAESEALPPKMNLWLLTHPDVRDNARVRALLLHIAERTPPLLEKMLSMLCVAKKRSLGMRRARRKSLGGKSSKTIEISDVSMMKLHLRHLRINFIDVIFLR